MLSACSGAGEGRRELNSTAGKPSKDAEVLDAEPSMQDAQASESGPRFGFGGLDTTDPKDAEPDAQLAPGKPPPAGFACEPTRYGDGVCDCGCGVTDVDCDGRSCSEPGCTATDCDLCHDHGLAPLPCDGRFACEASRFADGAHCDCGCGAPDPDCKGKGCIEPGCSAPACDIRHDESGKALRPSSYTCAQESFDGQDGCDCGCGAIDPDCYFGCAEPGCRADGCARCQREGGEPFECHFRCDLARLGDGVCDCGCGILDPDCGQLGCAETGCYASGCERCQGSDGVRACVRGKCASSVFGDGVCDCGCREVDPDCVSGSACVEPGCSDLGCGRCHDPAGEPVRCEAWLCGELEQQGKRDGCNCGCGAIDPDCDAELGCAEPGCKAKGCVTCRSFDSAPMSCAP